MSWIDDWTGGLVDRVLDAVKEPFRLALEWWSSVAESLVNPRLNTNLDRRAQEVNVGTSPLNPLARGIGAIINLMGHLRTLGEPDLQETRLHVLKDSTMYPPDSDMLARLMHMSPSHKAYTAAMAALQGKFPSVLAAYYELTRKQLDPSFVKDLYNRGVIDKTLATELLTEQGYRNERLEFTPDPDDLHWGFDPVSRGDLDNLMTLFSTLPALPDIVRMDVRDAFPKKPGQHPAWVRDHPTFAEWARTEGRTIKTITWPAEPGDITQALQMDKPPYGPQSFASHFLGGRQEYTEAFEAAAKAQGLDPYWSMKSWEAHWIIPGFQMARQMLHRVPEIDVHMFRSMMRWQDYPPNLLDALTQIAYRPLTRVDVRRMHLRGVIGVPRVFKSYLDYGYGIENAARMTAFTVTWNADRLYGGLVTEILTSFSEGALTEEIAVAQIWSVVGVTAPETLPSWVTDELTEDQIGALAITYTEIERQIRTWAATELTVAKAMKTLKVKRAELANAEKHYTKWDWTATQARQYLANKGYSQARIAALMQEWAPDRAAAEKLPTTGMLEDWLTEQDMSVSAWWAYMRRLKYSDEVITQILTGTGRLATQGMLESFYLEGLINTTQFTKQMTRLGFDQWTITKLLIVLDRALAEAAGGTEA